MSELDRDGAVDRLHAVALEDFVGERTRLARELRRAGDREAAAELAKWPKPTPAAWALNATARATPDQVGDWLAAAEALREASAHPNDGDALRSAMAAHRTVTTQMIAAVRDGARPSGRPLSEAMLERVRALLQAATADAKLAEDLRAGRIGEARDLDEADAPIPPKTPLAKRGTKPRRPTEPGDQQAARGAEEADREAARRAEQEEREATARAERERRVVEAQAVSDHARKASDARSADADAADGRVEAAERALHRSKSEAAAARSAAKEAAKALAGAERALKQLRRY